VTGTSAAENVEGERKTVTALFADIKGSMELIEDLDPEEARAIVDPALKLMIEAVQHYGGYVAQSTGDGIFAVFGAPVAHEDHPQRALYAALRIQEELKRYSDRTRAEGDLPIQARVGVNTGDVVVRSITTGEGRTEYAPVGHSTGIAARMQALAPVGSIAATEQIRKLCEGYFHFKFLGPTKVKGVSEPVNVYEVTGLGPLRTRLQRSALRGYTKFVGRQREMEAMRHAAEQAKAGHGQIVATVADAGVGKSRLLFEFKATSQSGWMVLETLSVSHGKASAYLPVIELLHGYFEIHAGDEPRRRREKVAGKIAILDRVLEDTLPYLFALLGIVEGEDPLAQMDGQVKKRRTLEAIKRILLRESLNQPLMVIFEDLHWIDGETQEFLNLFADSMGTAKLLLLVNYRPEYSHQWGSKTYYTQLRLDPLGEESAEEMLSALLGDSVDLAPLRRLIIEKTEGNPLFMEEIFQALLEDGTLQRNGGVKLVGAVEQLRLPPTVQGILAARIDRLPADEKDLLQTLAVIGKEFPLSLAREVVKKSDDELSRMLNDLQLAEFIYEQPTLGDIEYTFKHVLTQQVAYNSVLIERRKTLHERTATAIEALHAGHLDDHLVDLAYHYECSANLPKAIEYLWRVANQASQRSLYSEAIGQVSRGLELLGPMPRSDARARDDLRLHMMLGQALMAARGFSSEEVERAFSRAAELARGLGDFVQLFGALEGIWGYHYTRSNADAARKVAAESMAVAQDLKDPGLLKAAHYAWGASLQQAGDLSGSRDHLEQALALKNAPTFIEGLVRFGPDVNVMCLTALSDVLFGLGYPDQALSRSYEAMGVVKKESDPFSFAMAMLSVVQAHCGRREAGKAEELCLKAIELCTSQGYPFWLAVANRCMCWVTALQGRLKEGIAMMNQLLHDTAGADVEQELFNLLPFMAEAWGVLGEIDRAFTALEQWQGLRRRYSFTGLDLSILRIRGELLLRSGSFDEAEKSLRSAIELNVGQRAKMEQLRSTTALARLLSKQGYRDEARVTLAEIYNWFTEGFDTADLKDAKALLDELST
jgi:class 3 adenylate cyclase/tetratricopeptide (TPR) repeat protein